MNRFTPIAGLAPGSKTEAGSRRYWAFLSYAHADSAAAAKLHSKLERYRVPKALIGQPFPLGTIPPRLTPVFRDRQELAASSNLGREIEEALEASDCFVVLCSPAAAKSRWVDQEIRDYKRLHGEERVFAVILGGEPFSGEEDIECFPPALRQRIGPDGKDTGEPAEPIAADFREEGDGWRGGFLKLVAGMLDVGLDDLVQRDQQRRHKRMAWMAAASLAGMTVTSGLAIFALDSRNAAREERREAEGLVEFMLGDLRDELEPIGRLEALDKVGERALAYYERQDRKTLSDDQLAQRSHALTLLGRISISRGDTDGALKRVNEAMRSTGELVSRDPENPQRLFDHAQNVFWIGELARDLGRMDRAEAAYREYQSLADRMVAAEPDNLKWQMEVLYAKENVGIILINRRRYAEAARELDETAPVIERLAARFPKNDEYQFEMSNILAWLGDARQAEGKYDAALAARDKQIALLKHRLATGPENVRMTQQMLVAQRARARLLMDTGQPRRAIAELQSANVRAEGLLATEPDNASWKGLAAGLRLDLAEAFHSLGRTTAAESESRTGCDMVAALRKQNPDVTTWHASQTACYAIRARLAASRGAEPAALAIAELALDSARRERTLDPVRDRFHVASALRLVGEVQQRSGDAQAARKTWEAALAQLPSKVTERPRETNERAVLLRLLGRTEEARPLSEQLRKTGYRRMS